MQLKVFKSFLKDHADKLIFEFLSAIKSESQQVKTGSLAGASNAKKKMPKAKSSENEVRLSSTSG